MRKVVLLSTLVAPALAYADATVYPTGNYPDDVHAVQTALDSGGTVVLKATNTAGVATAFAFGAFGSVQLRLDVKLVGETTSAGTTTIAGGFFPIRSFLPVAAAVDGVTLDHPVDGGIIFIGPRSIEITGNTISHVVGFYREPLHTYGEAIVAAGGAITIDNNVIAGVDAFAGTGIEQFGSIGPVEVRGNVVSGTSSSAIECGGPGQISITNNYLRPGDNLHHVAAYGIEINGNGSFYVADNDVLVVTPGGVGIWAFGTTGFNFGAMTAPVITRNHVVMQPNTTLFGGLYNDGIDLAGLVSNASVTNNIVEGSGFSAFSAFALGFSPTDPSDLGHNSYIGNDISRVTAAVADVFLDTVTHDTVLKGFSGTVVDLGVNNAITGFSHLPGTGAQVSAAVQARAADDHLTNPASSVRPGP